MSVENGAYGVADGLVEIVAFDEHGKKSGNRAAMEAAGALENFGQQGKDRGRVALLAGGLARGEADLALGPCEPGDGIHEKQNVLCLVAEVFGDRERDESGA